MSSRRDLLYLLLIGVGHLVQDADGLRIHLQFVVIARLATLTIAQQLLQTQHIRMRRQVC
jgi:hypothetical protein